MVVIEIIYHLLGFILIFLVLFVAFKFFINYKYTEEKEMIAGVILLIAFLFGLIITSINLILGLFGTKIPLKDTDLRLLSPIFNAIMIICWLYVFYQLLYSSSNQMKIFFYAFSAINIIWVIIYFILGFSIGFSKFTIILEIYDIFSMVISIGALIILAVKSIRSRDRVLKSRGILLIIGFILAGSSLLFDDGIFTLETAMMDLLARIILIIGIFFIYQGFFLTGESNFYALLMKATKEQKEGPLEE
ncbi:MAG: membrane protein of unknown function [Promethearchaeota archaeon]|nr:MAG: membrane protein of unknown function [Candidatus Lokiarchaeota archaeon]